MTDAKIEAFWNASLDCVCPNCKEYVNLMEYADFWDNHSDIQIAQPEVDLEVVCPNCEYEFLVDTFW